MVPYGACYPIDPPVAMAVIPAAGGRAPHAVGVSMPYSLPVPLNMSGVIYPELQYARCMSNRYKADVFPRCVSCTRRWAGDTCRFQGIRFLLRDENRIVRAMSYTGDVKGLSTVKLNLPDKWNVELQESHIQRIMVSAALWS